MSYVCFVPLSFSFSLDSRARTKLALGFFAPVFVGENWLPSVYACGRCELCARDSPACVERYAARDAERQASAACANRSTEERTCGACHRTRRESVSD